MRILPCLFISVGITAWSGMVHAEVKPHALFRDHAVLQQEKPVPVWGAAKPGEKVSVRLAGHNIEAETDSNGRWIVRLPALPAGGPHRLLIEGENRLEFQDIWIGEVWICSGQSNMERQLGPRPPQQPLENWEKEVAAADYPQIRHFAVARTPSDSVKSVTDGKWEVCSPQTAAGFTAVGYYFGRDLHRKLKVPIGLIHSSWGGTPAEAWMSRDLLAADFPETLKAQEKAVSEYSAALARYRATEPELVKAWEDAAGQAKAAGKPAPPRPAPPVDPGANPKRPAGLYQGMIAPLIPYAFRGVIWYQGESNAGSSELYRRLFPALINDWRGRWGGDPFPFLFVQIAPFKNMNPAIRDAQLHAWKTTENTAMVVTTDVGDAEDIHPTRKEPVGARLALAARALAYGEEIEYSGPTFVRMLGDGSKAILHFEHRGGGLVAKDGPLRGFEISGDGKTFVPATAEIVGDKVVVSAPQVATALAVRYGWSNVPDVNLFNREGLPASPFRSSP